jgi:hypothetical protein
MSRGLLRSALGAGLALAVTALSACFQDPDGSHAGTATTTGNTITGRIVPETGETGGPIAASVTLYNQDYQPAFAGAGLHPLPEAIRVETRTDSTGRFSLKVPTGRNYVLVASSGGEAPWVHWETGIHARPDHDTLNLETLFIRPAAGLRGRILLPDLADSTLADREQSRLWVGFPGKGTFSPADRQGSFFLQELPAGRHILALLLDRRDTLGWSRETYLVEGIDLQEGRNHVLDSLVLPGNLPVTDTLRASACLADPVSLRPLSARTPGAGNPRALLRAFSQVFPFELIELDPCRGTWRRAASLAGNPSLLFSDSVSDFVGIESRREIVRIDPRTGAKETLAFPYNPSSAGFHGGRFYTLSEADSLLRIHPDESAFLANRASGTLRWPFPFEPERYDLSVVEGGIHYVVETDRLELYYLDLGDPAAPKPSPAKVLQGFTGGYEGFAGGYDGTVWVMNGANELYQYPVAGGAWIRKIPIEGAPTLRGLTQFP